MEKEILKRKKCTITNNIFAKIIKGQIPCKKIYEDDDVLFFEDINPASKVHVLGMPKVKCVDFSDFVYNNNKDVVDNFLKKINVVIEKLGIKDSGYRIITNSGSDGGQEVPHFHVHILGGEKNGPQDKMISSLYNNVIYYFFYTFNSFYSINKIFKLFRPRCYSCNVDLSLNCLKIITNYS